MNNYLESVAEHALTVCTNIIQHGGDPIYIVQSVAQAVAVPMRLRSALCNAHVTLDKIESHALTHNR